MLKYDSIAELVNEAEKRGLKLSELVLKTQAAMTEKTEEEMFATMERSLQVMKESVQDGLDKDKRSASGLTGGDAYKLNEALKAGKNIAGHFFGNAMMKAVAVAQTNACMGRIVASPTAGSCGILPSALLTLQEEKNISDKDLVMALFTASAVGIVIATNASVAGAAGGCQAECGSAAAMAAAALVYLEGGNPQQCADAAAFALMNLLGLVCDPVGGLVEVPCVYRNVGASGIAFTAADMVLSGIRCPIEPDEVILAMKEVGDALPTSLRETGEGGCAACESICKRLHHKE